MRGARIGIILAAVLLAGCGAKADLGAQPVASETSAQAALSEAQFLEMTRGLSYGAQPAITDAMLVNLADGVCAELVGETIRGPLADPLTWLPWKRTITILTDGANSWPAEEAGSFVVYSAGFKCPDKIATYLPPS